MLGSIYPRRLGRYPPINPICVATISSPIAKPGTGAGHAPQRPATKPPAAAQSGSSTIGTSANANLPANAQALVHQRMALVEALIGDRNAVVPHLAKAAEILGQQAAAGANHSAFSAVCYATLGDAAQAQANADAFMKAAPNNNFGHTLQALAAITAKNYDAAAQHLQAAPPNDLLAYELNAEIAKQQGRSDDAKAAKAAVLKRAVKADGGPGVDVIKLVARFRAEKL